MFNTVYYLPPLQLGSWRARDSGKKVRPHLGQGTRLFWL